MTLGNRSAAAWREKSRAFLEAHPICEVAGCGHLSQHTDHVIPRAMGGTDDDSNLSAKCASHHGKKTARERRGDAFGFAYGTER